MQSAPPTQERFQSLLRQALLEAQSRNPAYSLRALAKKLGVYPSALTEILAGRRKVSAKLARRMLDRLEVSPLEKQTALESLHGGTHGHVLQFTQMDMEQYHLISDWFHAAILSLVEIPGFKGQAQWVGRRLGITTVQARGALERLERLGMLEKDPRRGYRSTGKRYATSDEITNLSLRKAHHQNLDLAKRSLEHDPIERRDFTAMTMAIDPARLPEAKRMIREFRDRLCDYLEGGSKKEVHKVCVQLFPLTQENP